MHRRTLRALPLPPYRRLVGFGLHSYDTATHHTPHSVIVDRRTRGSSPTTARGEEAAKYRRKAKARRRLSSALRAVVDGADVLIGDGGGGGGAVVVVWCFCESGRGHAIELRWCA